MSIAIIVLIVLFFLIRKFKKICKHEWWEAVQLKKHRMEARQKQWYEKEEEHNRLHKWA